MWLLLLCIEVRKSRQSITSDESKLAFFLRSIVSANLMLNNFDCTHYIILTVVSPRDSLAVEQRWLLSIVRHCSDMVSSQVQSIELS